eukprot:6548443-Prymnesium_polylepis.1
MEPVHAARHSAHFYELESHRFSHCLEHMNQTGSRAQGAAGQELVDYMCGIHFAAELVAQLRLLPGRGKHFVHRIKATRGSKLCGKRSPKQVKHARQDALGVVANVCELGSQCLFEKVRSRIDKLACKWRSNQIEHTEDNRGRNVAQLTGHPLNHAEARLHE